jgi:hypothetical protein
MKEIGSHVARMEEGRSVFKILRGTPTGKRHLGRPRRGLKGNIRMDLYEIISIQGIILFRFNVFVNAALNLRVS